MLEGPQLVVGGGLNLPVRLGLGHLYARCQPPRSLENAQSLWCSSFLQPAVLLSSNGLFWLAGTSYGAGKAVTGRVLNAVVCASCAGAERNDLVMTAKCLPPWNKCKTIVMIQLQLLF